jgi:hypothetical protein
MSVFFSSCCRNLHSRHKMIRTALKNSYVILSSSHLLNFPQFEIHLTHCIQGFLKSVQTDCSALLVCPCLCVPLLNNSKILERFHTFPFKINASLYSTSFFHSSDILFLLVFQDLHFCYKQTNKQTNHNCHN